jgi:hypothetical protein
MEEVVQGVRGPLAEITLEDGGRLVARLDEDGASALEQLHRQLQESEFVRIGDDTLVRSAEVRWVQLRREQARGDRANVQRSRNAKAPAQRSSGPRVALLSETKPFFLTSEFVLALTAWIGLAITAAASDALDARTFWLLSVAIAALYAVSRGFAKAHTPSSAGDPREQW